MTLLLLLGGGVGSIYADTGGFDVPDPDDVTHLEFARWGETDSQIIRRGMLGEGVTMGCRVTAQSTPNLSVNVAGGSVSVGGSAKTVGGANLSIPTPDTANPRIDLIAIDSNGAIRLTQGTASGMPYPPDLPNGQVALAYMYVGAQATRILSADLVDKRVLRPS